MLLLLIIDSFFSVIKLFLAPLFVSISAIDAAIINFQAMTWAISAASEATAVLSYIAGSPFIIILPLTLSILLIPIELMASMFWWFVRKVPGASINK